MGCFENIMMNHNEKKIIGLCRRLNRKCSLTCNTDVTALCELAYRLYVSGDKKNALHVCECTHTGIPKKINYNVWDFILWIWGLEAYICDEEGRKEDKDFRITRMRKVWSTPKRSDENEKEAWAFVQKIMKRESFASVCKTEEIKQAADAGDKRLEKKYCFIALYGMIGYGVTGFYPDLEKNKAKLNEMIGEYMMRLRSM